MKPNVDALMKQVQNLTEAVQISERNQEYLQENLTVLEQQLTEQGWERIGTGYNRDFTERARALLYDSARIYWLKNPLIRRAELVQALYVFAQGMTVKADHPTVDAALQRFIGDKANYLAFTGPQAWMMNEAVIALSGNLFFALFTNESSGRVIVRQIPLYEIADIITNPEDGTTPWYYKRSYTINEFSTLTGIVTPRTAIAYYPDWRYNPEDKPDQIGGNPVFWTTPVYHAKVNCLPDMKFGVSELYSCLDWAKAYKTHLENGNKIWQALASFAFRMTTKGGTNAIAAATSKIKSLIGKPDGTTSTPDKRPVASTFASGEGVKLEPFKTSGMTISMEDARQHRLMVCSGSGIPDHIESGDPSTGNLATSTTMERPLELQFLNRQQFWIDIWQDITEYVIDQAIKAENGLLHDIGEAEHDDYTDEDQYVITEIDEGGKPIPRTVSVAFPPLLEHDQLQTVQAIIAGATLDGKPLAGTMDLKTLCQLILKALKVPNAEEILTALFPDGSPLVMQTAYTSQQQANAQAQALALAQQPRQSFGQHNPSDEEEWASVKGRNVDVPPGGIKEALGGVRGMPFDIENSQSYRESSAALIAARKKFAESILKGIEEHYPVEEGS